MCGPPSHPRIIVERVAPRKSFVMTRVGQLTSTTG